MMFELDPLRFAHPVLKASELSRKPVRVCVANRAFVLFRDAEGKPAALEDLCSHRLARLSGGKVKSGRIHCPYHDWNFGTDGKGVCPSQPELRVKSVAHFRVFEHFDFLWLANPDFENTQPSRMAPSDFTFLGAFSVSFKAPLHVVLANFSEDEHLPYVHAFLGWEPRDWSKVEFKSENFADRTEVQYRAPQRQTLTSLTLGLRPGDIFHNQWTTLFNPLRATFNLRWTDASRKKVRPLQFCSPIYMVPETDVTTWMHVFSFVKIDSRLSGLLIPLLKPGLLRSGKQEIVADANFMKHISHTPFDMSAMSLGRFDKPIVHNQKLLERVYFGRVRPDSGEQIGSGPSSSSFSLSSN